jgi:hypothetical protein
MMANVVPIEAVVAFGVPMLAVVVWGRRAMRRQAEAELRAEPLQPMTPEREGGMLLRHLSGPERVYVRTQLTFIPYAFLLALWVMLFQLTLPMVVASPHAQLWTDAGVMRWYSFVELLSAAPQVQTLTGFGAAVVAVMALRTRGPGTYYRTRPLAIGFLFWSRVLPSLAAFAAALGMAVVLALGLFALLNGPVWRHLPEAIPRVLGPDDSDMVATYAAIQASSVWEMLLSLLLGAVLFCAAAMTLLSMPWGGGAGSPVPRGPMFSALLLILVVPLVNLVGAFTGTHLPRWLFVYSRPGPPPPLIDALVPVGLTIALLLLASRLIRRVEI